MAKWADILVENFRPRVLSKLGLGYKDLEPVNPRLIMTSISAFGQDGPYRDYKATDIVVQALSGLLAQRGLPGREPVRAGGWIRMTETMGGMYGALATMSAFLCREQTDIGQHIDVSLMDSAYSMLPFPVAAHIWPYPPGVVPGVRSPARSKRGVHVPGIERCKDGYIGLSVLTGQQWRDLCLVMGMNDLADKPGYTDLFGRKSRQAEVTSRMQPWLNQHEAQWIFEQMQLVRVPAAICHSTESMLASPQHRDRGFFVEVQQQKAGKLIQPGPACRMAEGQWQIKSPAPLLGQHNLDVYGNMLHYTKGDLVKLKQMGII